MVYELLPHPPYSPDLNPIEKVWGYLKRKVMTKVYKNIDELIEARTDEWYKIPILMINNYIDAHIARVREVYEAEGNFPVK